MPLLWYLRDVLHLTGAKYACDDGRCGACTVLVDGHAKRACTLPMATLAGASVVTIEGLAAADGTLDPLQQAFVDHDAIGCGYCVPGQILAAKALLTHTHHVGDKDIDRIDNLCRCNRYPSFRAAIKAAAKASKGRK
ncbi:MAG TPA: 2Fe-2S iron-sulfur cluster-binding protein [Rhodanobacteraceae bacterium]|nr:2Fe-2S iron-sulfur cluster-binding protein [Rhodanobacteraceae bacterium]